MEELVRPCSLCISRRVVGHSAWNSSFRKSLNFSYTVPNFVCGFASAPMTSVFTGGLQLWENQDMPWSAPGRPKRNDSPCGSKTTDASRDTKKVQVQRATTSHSALPAPKSKAGCVNIFSEEYGPPPVPSKLSLEERYTLCRSVAEECIQDEELRALLEREPHPVCYDGFEPSGRMHIAQGIMKAVNVNKLTDTGCVFIFWVADWFAMLNNKMGGDLEKIKTVGRYFIEVWKAVGMRMDNVRFLWASEEINRNPDSYWTKVMDVARRSTITRIKRCCQIMGRTEGDEQAASNIMYPCMQCADIFHLKADICQLGMDQRKVNMLAREYADQVKIKRKPVILSHRMLPGLQEGQEKMSKSNPDSAIFMEDTIQDVNRKIKSAFCPPCILEGNPCVQYVEMLVFPKFNTFDVERKESNGGFVSYRTIEAFREAYRSGALHPGDLKPNLAKHLNAMLEPVRQHFAMDPTAKELLSKIKKYQAAAKKT